MEFVYPILPTAGESNRLCVLDDNVLIHKLPLFLLEEFVASGWLEASLSCP